MASESQPAWLLMRRRVRQIAPFAVAILLSFVVVALPPDERSLELVGAAGILVAILLTISIVAPWHRWPRLTQVAPALGFFLVIALLRHAAGGSQSGYGPLVLLPVIWLALYSTRAAVLIALGGVGATLMAPIVLFGPPQYPSNEWQRGLVVIAVAAVAGITVRDLLARNRLLSERLGALARTDALTELPNRRVWQEQLALELARAGRAGYPVSVAVIDLDNLKDVNDRLGHAAGDAVLQEATRAWQQRVRGSDLLARIGGDEFALLLPGCSAATAARVAARIVASPGAPAASTGVAEWDGREDGDSLVARADKDLYRNKPSRAETADPARHLSVV